MAKPIIKRGRKIFQEKPVKTLKLKCKVLKIGIKAGKKTF
jgi:hypothetical protein